MRNQIDDDIAKKIFQNCTGVLRDVFQVALDCNWGPPVSGRPEADFLHVWVAARVPAEASAYVYGRMNGYLDWNQKLEMKLVGSLGHGYSLFKLDSAVVLEEYVIMVDDGRQLSYDNNFGHNYYISPYGGRISTAIVAGKEIYNFGALVSYQLLRLK